MLSKRTVQRLANWKFERAREYMEADALVGTAKPSDEERDIVNNLALLFGNSGWLPGEINTLVVAAVRYLTPADQREPWELK